MTLIETLKYSEFVYSLVWTLVHSLWIGACAVVIAVILLITNKSTSAQQRYRIVFCAQCIALAGTAFAFIFTFSRSQQQALVSAEELLQFIKNTNLWPDSAQTFNLVTEYRSEIFILWSGVALVLLLRHFGAWFYCKKLNSQAQEINEPKLHQCMTNYKQQLGIKDTIALKVSTDLQSPCVIGFIRPCILLPLAMLNHLSVEDLQAILAHELAHIKRNDYLIGICQGIVKSIFFFNPFLLWLNNEINRERENCCDDTAVKLCGSTLHYAQVLEKVGVQSMQNSTAMAISPTQSNKKELYMRINRLINRQTLLEFRWTSFICTMICCLVIFTTTQVKADSLSALLKLVNKENQESIQGLSLEQTNSLLAESLLAMNAQMGLITDFSYRNQDAYRNLDTQSQKQLEQKLLDFLWQQHVNAYNGGDFDKFSAEDLQAYREISFETQYKNILNAGTPETIWEFRDSGGILAYLERFSHSERYQLKLMPEFISLLKNGVNTPLQRQDMNFDFKVKNNTITFNFNRHNNKAQKSINEVLAGRSTYSHGAGISDNEGKFINYSIAKNNSIISLNIDIPSLLSAINSNQTWSPNNYRYTTNGGLALIINPENDEGRSMKLAQIWRKYNSVIAPVIYESAEKEAQYKEQLPDLFNFESTLAMQKEVHAFVHQSELNPQQEQELIKNLTANRIATIEFNISGGNSLDEYKPDQSPALYSFDTWYYFAPDFETPSNSEKFDYIAKSKSPELFLKEMEALCPNVKHMNLKPGFEIALNYYFKNISCDSAFMLAGTVIGFSNKLK